jgi:death-on-curing protein
LPNADIQYLNLSDLISINRHAIQWFGGYYVKEGNNIRTPGSLDHCLLIIQGLYSVDPYPTIFQKAAFMWHRIASAQIFFDGNKRTATIAALSFLQLNGYVIEASDNEIVDVTLAMATKEIDIEQVTLWIEDRAKAKERNTWRRRSNR